MNYWHMNLHPTDDRRTDEEIRKFVLSRTIGMGRDFSEGQENAFKTTMKIGDIVAVLNGRTPIALVEVIGDWYEFDCDEKSIVWFSSRRSVKILCIKEDNGYIANLPQIPMERTKTLTISIDQNTPTYKYIHDWYEHCTNNA